MSQRVNTSGMPASGTPGYRSSSGLGASMRIRGVWMVGHPGGPERYQTPRLERYPGGPEKHQDTGYPLDHPDTPLVHRDTPLVHLDTQWSTWMVQRGITEDQRYPGGP